MTVENGGSENLTNDCGKWKLCEPQKMMVEKWRFCEPQKLLVENGGSASLRKRAV